MISGNVILKGKYRVSLRESRVRSRTSILSKKEKGPTILRKKRILGRVREGKDETRE